MISAFNLACGVAQSTLQFGYNVRNFRQYSTPIAKNDFIQAALSYMVYAYGYHLADKLYPILVDQIDLPSQGLYGIATRISLKLVVGHVFGSTFNSNINALRAWGTAISNKK